jgi:hypothetical protein
MTPDGPPTQRLRYAWRRTSRRVRWALARRLIREELEAFSDARYATLEAKVGGDLILARAILEGTSTLDQLPDSHVDVDLLRAKGIPRG